MSLPISTTFTSCCLPYLETLILYCQEKSETSCRFVSKYFTFFLIYAYVAPELLFPKKLQYRLYTMRANYFLVPKFACSTLLCWHKYLVNILSINPSWTNFEGIAAIFSRTKDKMTSELCYLNCLEFILNKYQILIWTVQVQRSRNPDFPVDLILSN